MLKVKNVIKVKKLEKVSIGHGCPRQMPFRKRVYMSSLFMTHRRNVMHAPVKFHEYIPYGLGVMARTRLTICN